MWKRFTEPVNLSPWVARRIIDLQNDILQCQLEIVRTQGRMATNRAEIAALQAWLDKQKEKDLLDKPITGAHNPSITGATNAKTSQDRPSSSDQDFHPKLPRGGN